MTMTVSNYEIEINEVRKGQELCAMLMKTPHYKKLGEEGIFAVVAKAKSMNISPLEALNGGMYSVQGKVEMSGVMMMSLIRQHGHSIKIDPRSTKTSVCLHGKRKDNGDEWTVSFSIEDAKTAGIYKATWEKYPQAMCIWRCVSMLGRYLFADVIKGCYVVGEISEVEPDMSDLMMTIPMEKIATIDETQIQELKAVFKETDDEYQKATWSSWKKLWQIKSWEDIPASEYDGLISGAMRRISDNIKKKEAEKQPTIDEMKAVMEGE